MRLAAAVAHPPPSPPIQALRIVACTSSVTIVALGCSRFKGRALRDKPSQAICSLTRPLPDGQFENFHPQGDIDPYPATDAPTRPTPSSVMSLFEADAVFIAELAQVVAVRAEDETVVVGDVPNVEPLPIPDGSAVDLVWHTTK